MIQMTMICFVIIVISERIGCDERIVDDIQVGLRCCILHGLAMLLLLLLLNFIGIPD